MDSGGPYRFVTHRLDISDTHRLVLGDGRVVDVLSVEHHALRSVATVRELDGGAVTRLTLPDDVDVLV